MEERDQISELPDPLLHLILSDHSIKVAFCTSVLSKRWNHICNVVPVLDFEDAIRGLGNASKVKKFMISVEKILRDRNQEANIKKFTFKCRKYMKPSRAQNHYLLFLRLFLLLSHLFRLIETEVTPRIRFPKYISFPTLKILTLNEITFSGKCEKLFAGCHVLEELSLCECTFPLREFCISCPMLKTLIINNSEGEEALIGGCALKINAPNLVSLYYWSNLAEDYIMSTFVALVKADFTFLIPGNDTMEQKIAASKFLGAVSHVKHLSIFALPIQDLLVSEDLLNNMPIFHKLNRLEVFRVKGDKTVVDLLKGSPNLEYFEFRLLLDDDYSEDDIEGFHTSFPHLKSVSFEEHYGHPRELKWMKLILKNAIALKRMNIGNCLEGLETRQAFMEEIHSVPRVSSFCVLEVFSGIVLSRSRD
ncbi:F-box/LRR-repeat protein At3g58900-like [Papaver somniferum]|uniref:F-box/LRR-repeat protein At3g58900-like n=1 Tax=Papaver somniferum TaxID=3469 RepID=UPI000E6F9298|nr:F-box/LRR-repeat protein At3g58900-like [Papaver somniferum]